MNNNIRHNAINKFIIKLDALEHIDYINVKIEATICEFFKIIGMTPNFLKSFNKNLEDIYVPNFIIQSGNKKLLIQIFCSLREYCLLLLTTSYIIERNDFKIANIGIFNKYVIEKYVKNAECYHPCDDDNVLRDINADIIKYSNISIYKHNNQILVIPCIIDAFNIQSDIVSAIKNFSMAIKLNYHCNVSPSIIINYNEKHFNINITEMPARMFLLSENINRIISYPQEADINWFYSIIKYKNKCPIYMHKYMMKLKSMLKYDDKHIYKKIDFYDYVKKYNVSKQNQDMILLEDKYSLHVNIYGDIIRSENCWSFIDTISLDMNNRDFIELDQDIVKENNKLKLDINHEKIRKLFKVCDITYDKEKWLFSKLMETDFSSMNIHHATNLYKSQLKKVEPIVVTKSFCSLNLNKKQQITILKLLLDYDYNICIDEDNNYIDPYSERMIFDGESIPTNTIISFDMEYCLLCKKSANTTEITIGLLYIKKKRKEITQPYFCKKCIKCMELIKYGKNYPSIDVYSHKMHFTSDVIDMMDIIKNNTTLILGFKYDNNSTLQYLIYDIIQVIIFHYVNSIKF